MSRGRVPRRLARILALIPYAVRNPGVTVDELAERFGATRRQVTDDLELIFLCGLPGYTPADLIEVDLEGDAVFVRTQDYLEAPLRLTPAEGLALYAGAATLAALPEMRHADALPRALAKLGRALGIDAGGDGEAGVRVDVGPGAHVRSLQQALERGRRVRLQYMSASRGELTEREVDPWGVMAALGHWYLIGFDHASGEERMFRTDRMKAVEITGVDARVPADFDLERYRGAFIGAGDLTLTLEIAPEVARWFEDYYPVLSSREVGDGWREVSLTAGGLRWAAMLVLKLSRGARSVRPPEVVTEARRIARAISLRHR